MKKLRVKITRINAESQRGLSLVELMISITIGLIILVSLTALFVNQNKARTELDKANRMIDNGRYALELLSGNLQLTGFFGTYVPTGNATSIPDPCDTAAMANAALNIDLMRMPVHGYDAATASSQIAVPPALCAFTNTAGSAESLKPGSDILVVRRANTSSITQAAAAAAGINGTTYLQVSSCQHDTTAFIISADPSVLILGQRNITSPSPLNNCFSAGGITTIAAPYADVRALKTEVYFVSPDNNPGDGIPTLKRRELSISGGAPVFVTTPLVEGIEFMQVEYGIDDPAQDTDGDGVAGLDGVPDFYDACAACTLEQWSNVVSVKLYLVARNIEKTSGYADSKAYSLGSAGSYTPAGDNAGFKRHAYTQNIRLINPSGRREVP